MNSNIIDQILNDLRKENPRQYNSLLLHERPLIPYLQGEKTFTTSLHVNILYGKPQIGKTNVAQREQSCFMLQGYRVFKVTKKNTKLRNQDHVRFVEMNKRYDMDLSIQEYSENKKTYKSKQGVLYSFLMHDGYNTNLLRNMIKEYDPTTNNNKPIILFIDEYHLLTNALQELVLYLAEGKTFDKPLNILASMILSRRPIVIFAISATPYVYKDIYMQLGIETYIYKIPEDPRQGQYYIDLCTIGESKNPVIKRNSYDINLPISDLIENLILENEIYGNKPDHKIIRVVIIYDSRQNAIQNEHCLALNNKFKDRNIISYVVNQSQEDSIPQLYRKSLGNDMIILIGNLLITEGLSFYDSFIKENLTYVFHPSDLILLNSKFNKGEEGEEGEESEEDNELENNDDILGEDKKLRKKRIFDPNYEAQKWVQTVMRIGSYRYENIIPEVHTPTLWYPSHTAYEAYFKKDGELDTHYHNYYYEDDIKRVNVPWNSSIAPTKLWKIDKNRRNGVTMRIHHKQNLYDELENEYIESKLEIIPINEITNDSEILDKNIPDMYGSEHNLIKQEFRTKILSELSKKRKDLQHLDKNAMQYQYNFLDDERRVIEALYESGNSRHLCKKDTVTSCISVLPDVIFGIIEQKIDPRLVTGKDLGIYILPEEELIYKDQQSFRLFRRYKDLIMVFTSGSGNDQIKHKTGSAPILIPNSIIVSAKEEFSQPTSDKVRYDALLTKALKKGLGERNKALEDKIKKKVHPSDAIPRNCSCKLHEITRESNSEESKINKAWDWISTLDIIKNQKSGSIQNQTTNKIKIIPIITRKNTININDNMDTPHTAQSSSSDEDFDQCKERLKKLEKFKELLSDEEYKIKRKEIVDQYL